MLRLLEIGTAVLEEEIFICHESIFTKLLL